MLLNPFQNYLAPTPLLRRDFQNKINHWSSVRKAAFSVLSSPWVFSVGLLPTDNWGNPEAFYGSIYFAFYTVLCTDIHVTKDIGSHAHWNSEDTDSNKIIFPYQKVLQKIRGVQWMLELTSLKYLLCIRKLSYKNIIEFAKWNIQNVRSVRTGLLGTPSAHILHIPSVGHNPWSVDLRSRAANCPWV